MSTIMSYPDRTLLATLSGGSWNSAYPLGNIQDDQLSVKARSTNALTTSTIILIDLGSTARAIRCLGLLSHTISYAGTIRVRGYSDNGYTTLVTDADTGTVYAYDQTLGSEMSTNYPDHWIYAFSSAKTARYWKIEITDTTNAAGFVELGRVWLGEGTLAPTVSIAYGTSLGYESRDVVVESIGGAIWGDSKASRRVIGGTFEALTGEEQRTALIMQKTLGKTGELLFILNSENTAIDMQLQSFPATMRNVNLLEFSYFQNSSNSIDFVEILNNNNVEYIMGGGASDVYARQ